MKIILGLISCFILISTNTLKSQEDNSRTDPKDPIAKEILKKLSIKTKALKSFEASFTYTLENKDANLDETESGKILVSGEKYNLEISGQQIISDGKSLWTFIKDANEVTIDNANNDDEDDLNPAKLFTIYDEGFKYQYAGEKTEKGKVIQTIKLFPIDANEKPFHTVILKINKSLNEISSIQIKMKDGNIFTYNIDLFKKDVTITSASFSFDTSTADDVIDLRDE